MPSSTFVMVLDHVLRRPATQAVNVQGMQLYNALTGIGRLAILCGEDEERASYFLKTNGFNQHAYLIPEKPDSADTPAGRRLAQITELRAMQAHIEFVIEPDPALAVEIFRQGIPVLPYLHPQYTQPSFRPDYSSTATPWENLTKELEFQLSLKASQDYSAEDD